MALSAGSGELGPHLPGHRNSLRLLRPWATQWALWSTRELQRYSGYSAPSHPAKWWVLGRLHSSQASLRPAGIQLLYHFRVRKPSSCLGLCIPAMSPFLFWHHETSLAPPGKRTQTPSSLCGLCGISIPIPAQLGEVAGLWDIPLGTHLWGPTSVSALLASVPTPLSSSSGQCFLALRASKPLSLHAPNSSSSVEALGSKTQAKNTCVIFFLLSEQVSHNTQLTE